ncbi:MAG: hypothetical protein AAGA68_25200 [Pseudomonadota bacterium]
MTITAHHRIAFWLLASVALLSTLIPGGPVENRDFSHIHPAVLGAFNIFLTTLDLGALVLAVFALQRPRRWVAAWAFVAAIGFFGVYAIDLAQIFPRSPTPMSFALALIEVLGMCAAVPLMFAARNAVEWVETSEPMAVDRRSMPLAATAALILIGLGVVWFATDAAMQERAPQAANVSILSN